MWCKKIWVNTPSFIFNLFNKVFVSTLNMDTFSVLKSSSKSQSFIIKIDCRVLLWKAIKHWAKAFKFINRSKLMFQFRINPCGNLELKVSCCNKLLVLRPNLGFFQHTSWFRSSSHRHFLRAQLQSWQNRQVQVLNWPNRVVRCPTLPA